MAVNMLKQETTAKVGIKAKRKKAGWDYDYLLKVLYLKCDCPGRPYLFSLHGSNLEDPRMSFRT